MVSMQFGSLCIVRSTYSKEVYGRTDILCSPSNSLQMIDCDLTIKEIFAHFFLQILSAIINFVQIDYPFSLNFEDNFFRK